MPVQVETRTSVQQEDEELGVGKLTGDVNEIVIPTASYRMGVPHMGLGLVSVTSQGDVFYTNLWLPSRYKIKYSRFHKNRTNMNITTLGREPVSIIYYTRTGSRIKRPTLN